MEKNQFHLLEEIVNEVSGKGDDETKIQFLKDNPEIMFREFRWMNQSNKLQERVLNSIFERQFNVRSQLEKLKQGGELNGRILFSPNLLKNKKQTSDRTA